MRDISDLTEEKKEGLSNKICEPYIRKDLGGPSNRSTVLCIRGSERCCFLFLFGFICFEGDAKEAFFGREIFAIPCKTLQTPEFEA